MKTSELIGAALDWAVALITFPEPDYEESDRLAYVCGDDEFHFAPSANWAQGGEIIERERIELNYDDAIGWTAAYMDVRGLVECIGSTPLIAAMRCYVASKLGDEVEIPDEVTPC